MRISDWSSDVCSSDLYPGRLLDTVGRFLAPLKIIALAVLGIAAFALPAGDIGVATPQYEAAPFSQGFINGYLTMDTLGALVRSEEHTSELQSLMRISYAVFCLKKKKNIT